MKNPSLVKFGAAMLGLLIVLYLVNRQYPDLKCYRHFLSEENRQICLFQNEAAELGRKMNALGL